jgi:hypothetical protein
LEAAPEGTAAKEGISMRLAAHGRQRFLGGLAILAGLFLLPGTARAAEQYTYSIGALGGIGGSWDVDPGSAFTNQGFQLNLAMVSEPHTLVGFRLGKLNLDKKDQFGTLHDAGLTYLTVAGEYRFQESYYDSGVYLGLGGYRLSGTRADGRSRDQTSVGLAVGITAEFPINRWFALLVEASGHYVDLDEANLFGMAHGGIAFHF